MSEWTPQYERWRHGGWYVVNTRYPKGGCGCVSRNYPDKQWRIVDMSHGITYRTRDEAARAEHNIVNTLCQCGARPCWNDRYCADCGAEIVRQEPA